MGFYKLLKRFFIKNLSNYISRIKCKNKSLKTTKDRLI